MKQTTIRVLTASGLIALAAVGLYVSGLLKNKVDSKLLASIAGIETNGINCDGRASLPVHFELNKGQEKDPMVKYAFNGQCYKLRITPNGLKVSVPDQSQPGAFSAPIMITFENAKSSAALGGVGVLPGKANYFRSSNRAEWVTGVPLYEKVSQAGIYPGIDILHYGNSQKIESDFIVSPGGDPNDILLGFSNIKAMNLDSGGNIVLKTDAGELKLTKPVAYQTIGGAKKEISVQYVIDEGKARFALGEYDKSQILVIDPVIVYSTYLSATGFQLNDIAVDFFGNVYVTGLQDRDVFVSKISSAGELVYYSLFGSNAEDRGTNIAIDSNGNAFVTGVTGDWEKSSPVNELFFNFPITGDAIQAGFNGGAEDAFVLKLSAEGSTLLYSTYLGGSGGDNGNGITVDASGNIYVTGFTQSSNFPTTSAYQATFGGGEDAFVSKISSNGSLAYSTYLGGKGEDSGASLAVDSSGNMYIAGTTRSADFPTTISAIQLALSGSLDAFVSKINANGASLAYSTYLGGDGLEKASAIDVDNSGNAYLTGVTNSANFPTLAALHGTLGGVEDVFVSKINSTGLALAYSTYLGGSLPDSGQSIFVDRGSGTAYVTGITYSNNFPTVGAIQSNKASDFPDAFISKINADGSAYYYSSYLGGTGNESGLGIYANALGEAFFVGVTDSQDFPLVNPIATSGNIFLVRVDIADILEVDTKTISGGSSVLASAIPKSSGTSGVEVNLINNSDISDTDTIRVARFASNPGTANVIDFGGGFMDIQTLNVEPEDDLISELYYSSETKDVNEAALTLTYFDGVNWVPVLSSGGLPPSKDTTDNLEGTVSGGEFTVTFDDTSIPKITDLAGTAMVFVQGDPSVAIQDIINTVKSLGLKKSDEKKLIKPLEKAQKNLEQEKKDKDGNKDDDEDDEDNDDGKKNKKEKKHPAVKQLEKFINEVEKMSKRGSLNKKDAASLINLAEILIAEINKP